MSVWDEIESRGSDEIRARHLSFKAKIAQNAVDDPGISCPSASRKTSRQQANTTINVFPQTLPQPVAKHWFWIVDEVNKPSPIRDIQKLVANHFNVTMTDIVSERRTARVVRPRQTAMYLAKIITTKSLPEIGRRFGDRDHTTVLHAIRKTISRMEADPAFAAEVEGLRLQITGGTTE